MTRLVNNPDNFPSQAVAGLVSAFPNHLRPVFGGVVRAARTDRKVALVVGGGSGHYPAFAGWVGPGFADGAVCGNIFSSPSASQAYAVCKAADRGAGLLIGFGNYAGDVLHFGQAAERLRSEGIDARCLLVTDDIASAPDHLKRRGIAGDLPVFKVTAAACEEGRDIDEVVAIFDRVNDRTRSLGVAFAGCTLPGADEPLFRVEAGQMGVGMGIHGEPGIHDETLGTADEVAAMLVNRLLADRPENPGTRVVPIVNGLGSTKYEELFVLWNDISRHLEKAGLAIVDPQVGEFVTSLDMAGVSLTLVWLDDVIEPLWLAAHATLPRTDAELSVRWILIPRRCPRRLSGSWLLTRDLELPGVLRALSSKLWKWWRRGCRNAVASWAVSILWLATVTTVLAWHVGPGLPLPRHDG